MAAAKSVHQMQGFVGSYDPAGRCGMIETEGGPSFLFTLSDVTDGWIPEEGAPVRFETDPYIADIPCARKVRAAKLQNTERMLGLSEFDNIKRCPWCEKTTEPVVVFKDGSPHKELCEHCRGTLGELVEPVPGSSGRSSALRWIGYLLLAGAAGAIASRVLAALF